MKPEEIDNLIKQMEEARIFLARAENKKVEATLEIAREKSHIENIKNQIADYMVTNQADHIETERSTIACSPNPATLVINEEALAKHGKALPIVIVEQVNTQKLNKNKIKKLLKENENFREDFGHIFKLESSGHRLTIKGKKK